MVTVCAWCEKYMGSKEPFEDPGITHGICSVCMEQETVSDPPVLVVSPDRAATIPLLSTLLRGSPDIAIVVDRRGGERRYGAGNGHRRGNGLPMALDADRRVDDRRRVPALYLV